MPHWEIIDTDTDTILLVLEKYPKNSILLISFSQDGSRNNILITQGYYYIDLGDGRWNITEVPYIKTKDPKDFLYHIISFSNSKILYIGYEYATALEIPLDWSSSKENLFMEIYPCLEETMNNSGKVPKYDSSVKLFDTLVKYCHVGSYKSCNVIKANILTNVSMRLMQKLGENFLVVKNKEKKGEEEDDEESKPFPIDRLIKGFFIISIGWFIGFILNIILDYLL